MARHATVGIDIGSWETKIVVCEMSPTPTNNPRESLRIISSTKSESRGIRHGYVIHKNEAVKSIEEVVARAEKDSGQKIRRVFLSIGGIGLQSTLSSGSIIVSRADSEITELDLTKALDASQNALPESATLNRKIIHAIPLSYKIDSKSALGNPIGMKGMKLEVRALFVTCLEHHLNDLIQTVEDAGLEVVDVTPSPFAAAHVMLNKAQRMAGCVLANIGSETVSIVVYENNLPVSLEVFPIGSNDITNDIALGLRIPLDEAEQVKLGSVVGGNYPKKKLDEIISARLSDIFDLIEAHLRKIGKSGLLPAGIILTGGGASFSAIEEFARGYLKLPSSIARMTQVQNLPNQASKVETRDSSWSVAYGVCVYGLSADEGGSVKSNNDGLQRIFHNIVQWFKQFLP